MLFSNLYTHINIQYIYIYICICLYIYIRMYTYTYSLFLCSFSQGLKNSFDTFSICWTRSRCSMYLWGTYLGRTWEKFSLLRCWLRWPRRALGQLGQVFKVTWSFHHNMHSAAGVASVGGKRKEDYAWYTSARTHGRNKRRKRMQSVRCHGNSLWESWNFNRALQLCSTRLRLFLPRAKSFSLQIC